MEGQVKASSEESEGKLEEQAHSASTSGPQMDRLEDKISRLHIKRAQEQNQLKKSFTLILMNKNHI